MKPIGFLYGLPVMVDPTLEVNEIRVKTYGVWQDLIKRIAAQAEFGVPAVISAMQDAAAYHEFKVEHPECHHDAVWMGLRKGKLYCTACEMKQ